MRHSILSPLALALALATGCAFGTSTAQARGGVVIYAPIGPPPVRVERVPPPRMGYVWIDGSWGWSHNRYHWNRGYWERERHGRRYVPPRWERDHRGWRREGGYWGR